MWWRLSIGFRLIKAFGLRRSINFFINQVSYLITLVSGKIVVWGKPFALTIEPTNYCNLFCPECISGKKAFNRPLGYIDFELYKKIIDEVKSHVAYLMLNFQGESFLHSDLINMIEYANTRNIFVSISTNGHFIDKQGFGALIDSGLSELIVSLDGTTQEVYEQYRIGGTFNKVLENIKGLIKEKDIRKEVFPIVKLQFLVFRFNEHQMQAVKKLARELNVDALVFKSAQLYDLQNIENRSLPIKNKKYSRYIADAAGGSIVLKKKNSGACFRLWSTSVITHDGRVVPCCFDKDAAYSLGKIYEDSFKNIWRGKKYHAFRKQAKTITKPPCICLNCDD
jgi:radical SAM protein with 4Fe4S-binding SPASM domain